MNFLDRIYLRLEEAADRPVLQEWRNGELVAVSGLQLLSEIRSARHYLRASGIGKGERCGLVAHNSIRWAALDLALLSEGIIRVPLYARQTPRELALMLKDAQPSLICCGDAGLQQGIAQSWSGAPRISLLDEVFAAGPTEAGPPPVAVEDADVLAIIYTSGTSGEPKGVMLNAGNLNHIVPCTNARLNQLTGEREGPDRVFHYLPFCFAGSWILLLTCLSRPCILTLSADLTKLREEMRAAEPEYFLNVPTLLERVRTSIDTELRKKGGLPFRLFERGRSAWLKAQARGVSASSGASAVDQVCLRLAERFVFPAIRKRLGVRLKALICGSAALAPETQRFFHMLGLPVLQVYGLTETTAICTMDEPGRAVPGRVGPAIPGIEMRLGEEAEILIRGPHIFPGYWNRPDATAEALRDGWLHTGDQGEVDPDGNWSIIGRLKNLIILNSGHNVAPEPIEQLLLAGIPKAEQVVLVGHGRSYLSAIITGDVAEPDVEGALETVNQRLPHYQRIRAHHLHPEPFSADNGLLTANGKLKREAIAQRFRVNIEEMYPARTA